MNTRKRELTMIPLAAREVWLEEHHTTSDGLWLKFARKGSGIETGSLDVALCYGWIDSRADSFDDQHWLLRFTPHRPRSKWSQVNRLKVGKLIEEGRMKPAGLREVKRAKAHGRWEE
jgi:uncharacterized protein YdeI (YjbR/CyaY-like superfamily)